MANLEPPDSKFYKEMLTFIQTNPSIIYVEMGSSGFHIRTREGEFYEIQITKNPKNNKIK